MEAPTHVHKQDSGQIRPARFPVRYGSRVPARRKGGTSGILQPAPPESGWNRNPALDSGTPKTGTKAGMCNLVCIGRLKCVGNMSHTPFAFSEMVLV